MTTLVDGPLYTLQEWASIVSDPTRCPESKAPRLYAERPPANGFVYFVQMGDSGPIKIGFTINAQRRLDSLQSCNPEQLNLRLAVPGSTWDEEEYQGDFRRSRIRGEWYRPTGDLLEFIRLANECKDSS